MFKQYVVPILKEADVVIGGERPWDIAVYDDSVYRRVAFFGSLGLGEAYMDKQWDAQAPDAVITKLLEHGAREKVQGLIEIVEKVQRTAINMQSVLRAFQVAQQHYDLDSRLYEEMLGESMGYSSGYYRDGAENITQAQHAKFQRICEKLALKKGMRLLEIGVGFGTFAEYAVKNYEVEVVGLTVSEGQKQYAQKRCEGLPVELVLTDYRMYKNTGKPFDRAVSIEMIEAVGPKNFCDYFESVHKVLRDDGLFLMQAILAKASSIPVPDPWISKYIFPNGILPSLPQLQKAMHGLFTLGEYEAFGGDYDKTLMEWDERFRARWDTIRAYNPEVFTERFYRMWRYYLLMCAATFRARETDVAHLVLRKGVDPRFS